MSHFKSKIAAQLYSVRDEFEKDCEGTLKTLKEIGFEAVQLDGMRGNDPHDVAELIRKYEFNIAGMHIDHDRFLYDLDGIIEEAYIFGCKTVYDKYINDEKQYEDGYRETKTALVQAAKNLSALGFRIGLHNPEYDYNNIVDGRKILDFMTDPVHGVCIYAEPDTYWMAVAGENPVESIKKYSGRAPVVHLKDFKSGYEPTDIKNNLTEVGAGEIDMEAIIHWGENHGVEYYCIEQDYSSIGIFDSLAFGFSHVMNIGKALEKND
ncbi:TIM barrel protein [Bacillaceae bacterium SIJ1]|uniref:sugar phosphate isomerase/epimerase family protein n=1 Tax=Litoribacterium kuwaitense TaxID=1398745 RepID=UPI0013EB436E|nr:TIM barrel protein [Litoribacterium kuwaitense]NGP46190.1 TIM barrel protein [Litoribacterium kuwaitense]